MKVQISEEMIVRLSEEALIMPFRPCTKKLFCVLIYSSVITECFPLIVSFIIGGGGAQ
jgi:hypothetical protein